MGAGPRDWLILIQSSTLLLKVFDPSSYEMFARDHGVLRGLQARPRKSSAYFSHSSISSCNTELFRPHATAKPCRANRVYFVSAAKLLKMLRSFDRRRHRLEAEPGSRCSFQHLQSHLRPRMGSRVEATIVRDGSILQSSAFEVTR